jgi:hypothetical protein
MNYLKWIMVPVVAGLFVAALSGCPKPADQTNVAITEDANTPGTTVVETEDAPPVGDTNIEINVDTDPNAPVVVKSEEVRTNYPEVVSVVERTVAAPTVTDNTVYIAEAPAIKVWTEQIVPANAPADVVYRVRDLNVLEATDTQITADGYVLVTSPAEGFTSERKYVTYTFQKDPTTSQWLVYDLKVDRVEPATAEDMGTPAGDGGHSEEGHDHNAPGHQEHGEGGGETGSGS